MTSAPPPPFPPTPDQLIQMDGWSDVANTLTIPEINFDRLYHYRLERVREEMRKDEIGLLILVSPISLKYALNYGNYALFQSHIPTTYAFIPLEGPTIVYNAYGDGEAQVDAFRTGRPNSFFDGGFELDEAARLLADDVVGFLSEVGSTNRRVAVEYINPSVTQALLQRGFEVLDGVQTAEAARVIKSDDEIACLRWACAVGEFAIQTVKRAIRPGVTENQLWGLLNYTNLANNGLWHDGRMLCSGPRTNPWLQEAGPRVVEANDLVAFDIDMIGPNGYFADISRTFICPPSRPTKRQKQLYQLAMAEIDHNRTLIRAGVSFRELQQKAYLQDEAFHENAYTCILHGVGLCDEYPRVNPIFRGPNPYDDMLEAGMVITLESYVGAVGEPDGVKLEDQVLITEDGCEPLSSFEREAAFLE